MWEDLKVLKKTQNPQKHICETNEGNVYGTPPFFQSKASSVTNLSNSWHFL